MLLNNVDISKSKRIDIVRYMDFCDIYFDIQLILPEILHNTKGVGEDGWLSWKDDGGWPDKGYPYDHGDPGMDLQFWIKWGCPIAVKIGIWKELWQPISLSFILWCQVLLWIELWWLVCWNLSSQNLWRIYWCRHYGRKGRILNCFFSWYSDAFRFLGHAPPFFPLPFGIVVSANFDKFGTFLLFLKHSTNSSSFLRISATTTQWKHIPIPFQFAQSASQEKAPPFLGSTRWGLLPW